MDVLGVPFTAFLPVTGYLDRNLIHTFLWARLAEGANRQMILSELKYWKDIMMEIGDAVWPHEWTTLKVNRLFPVHAKPAAKAKEALSIGYVRIMLESLSKKAASKDEIEATLAIRDIWILLLGFGHLLRKSELIAVKLSHVRWEAGHIFIPRSKTD